MNREFTWLQCPVPRRKLTIHQYRNYSWVCLDLPLYLPFQEQRIRASVFIMQLRETWTFLKMRRGINVYRLLWHSGKHHGFLYVLWNLRMLTKILTCTIKGSFMECSHCQTQTPIKMGCIELCGVHTTRH